MTYHNGVRRISVRYDVVRKGARITQLHAKEPATINMIADAQLKTYITGTFAKNDVIDLLNDHIRPYLVIDGVAYPLGDYIVSVAETSMQSTGQEVKIEAYDQSLIASQNRLENRASFPAGALYIDVVQGLLQDCGITMVMADPSSAALSTVREDWEAGTAYLDIINALLAEINYKPLWFDYDGFARLQKNIAPSASNIDFEYKADRMSILSADATASMDIFNAPNVFIVEVSNPDLPAPLRAVSVNEDPGSILSTIRRGRRIVAPIERLDNIASQEALQEYADNKRLQSMLSTDTIAFETALEPGHGVGNVVAVHHPDFSGVYQEIEWDMTLAPGALMRHRARRLIYL